MAPKPQRFYRQPLLGVLAANSGRLERDRANSELEKLLAPALTEEDWDEESNDRHGEPLWHNRVSSLVRGLREPRSGILVPTNESGTGTWELTSRGWAEAIQAGAPQFPPLAYTPRPPPVPTSTRDPFAVDPDAIDRGLLAHHETIEALAAEVVKGGATPSRTLAGAPPFDLCWSVGDVLHIAEVKSTTPENREKQLRLGLGQVLRYRHLMGGAGRWDAVVAWLVPELKPGPSWSETCESVGVRVWWPGRGAMLG